MKKQSPPFGFLKKSPTRIKIIFFYFICWVGALLISALAGEALLRVFWNNPYSVQPLAQDYQGFVRLQLPNVDVRYDVSGLYPGQTTVRFRTEDDGRVHNATHGSGPVVHFYGGSTTEARYVPEGSRWPEIIPAIVGHNWGVSGNHLLDSYFNFKFHCDQTSAPDYAVFMHAVNDFSARNIFEANKYVEIMGQARQSNRGVNERIYLIDFVENLYELRFGISNVRKRIEYNIANSNFKGHPLTERGYLDFIESNVLPFLEQRTKVLNDIVLLAKSKNVKVILLTQPHAYGKNFVPKSGGDIRDLPVIDGGRYLTHAQIGAILDMINENTRKFAKSNGVYIMDVGAIFDALDVSDYFYDGVHYTEKGSIAFGRVVSSAAPW